MEEYEIAKKGVLNPDGVKKFCKENGFPEEEVQKALDACGEISDNAPECQRAIHTAKCLTKTFCPKNQGADAQKNIMRRLRAKQ